MPGHKTHPSKRDPRGWQQLKAQAWLAANGKPICPRCNRPITGPLNTMDLGHKDDWATHQPGEPTVLQLEHARCNRKAGQQLGQQLKALRKTPKPWTTTELTGR